MKFRMLEKSCANKELTERKFQGYSKVTGKRDFFILFLLYIFFCSLYFVYFCIL